VVFRILSSSTYPPVRSRRRNCRIPLRISARNCRSFLPQIATGLWIESSSQFSPSLIHTTCALGHSFTMRRKKLIPFPLAFVSAAQSARHCCTPARQTCRHHHALHPRFRLKASLCSSSKTSRHAFSPSNKKSESRWHLQRRSRPYAVPLFWRKTSSHLIHSGGGSNYDSDRIHSAGSQRTAESNAR